MTQGKDIELAESKEESGQIVAFPNSSRPIRLSEISNSGPGRSGTFKRWLPHIIAGVALVCLIVVSCLFWLEVNRRFPRIEPGMYLGEIEKGVLQNESVPFYVEKGFDSEELLILLLKEGSLPQLLTPISSSSDGGQTEAFLPLSVANAGERLGFIGNSTGQKSYEGLVTNSANGKKGHWKLSEIRQDELVPLPSGGSLALVRTWLRLAADLKDVDTGIADAEIKVPARQAEIDNLESVVSEGEKLKAKANQKFTAVSEELKRVKKNVVERREEAKRAEGSFAVSRRVTPMGKLVSLSRESLERDWRWADSLMRTDSGPEDVGNEEMFEKGQKILALKKEIEKERESLQKASSASSSSEQQSSASNNAASFFNEE